MAKPKKTLHAKLIKVFLIQISLISLVTIGGIYAAKTTVEDLLVRQALKGEAAHFWQLRQSANDFPLPNTMNMVGYMAQEGDFSAVPRELWSLSPGFQHGVLGQKQAIVYVEDKGQDRLFLVFDENNVSQLAIIFGVLPLTAVLIVLYLLAWFAYRQSHKAVSPIVKLARAVDDAELRDGNLPDLDLQELRKIPDEEVSSLVRALDQFTQRIELFIERERLFTRDASHELRTPIAVLRSAMELLERRYAFTEDATTRRIYRTFYDMEALLETLLILAREQEQLLPLTQVNVNQLVQNELDNLTALFEDKQIQATIEQQTELVLTAPERVVQILISNLLRNAFNYTTQGTITVTIWTQGFSISDSGIGMDKIQLKQVFKPFFRANEQIESGYGLGMNIVKRLCNRYNWHIRITSAPQQGTEVSVLFPKSQLAK